MCFKHKNYGSMLQSFAMQQYFVKNEIPFECINYAFTNSFWCAVKKLHLLFITSARKMKMRIFKRNMIIKFRASKEMKENFKIRNSFFEKFSKTNFITSELIFNWKELVQKSKDYSSVILGSDQVWHPINLGSHFYDLSWVENFVPKYAFSSSFGVSQIPWIQKNATRNFLNSFKSISVREKTGQKIVKELTGNDCLNTLDPTLLYDADEWSKMLGLDEKKVPYDNYIFCYFLGASSEHRKFANELKEKTSLKIVSLIHLDEYIPTDNTFGDFRPFDIGPAEFVNLIRNASYVCTDSFHGTVFSLLFQKKLASFNRYKAKSSASANSRISDLFCMLGIERIVWTDASEFAESYPYALESFKDNLAIERKKSFDYMLKISKGKLIE